MFLKYVYAFGKWLETVEWENAFFSSNKAFKLFSFTLTNAQAVVIASGIKAVCSSNVYTRSVRLCSVELYLQKFSTPIKILRCLFSSVLTVVRNNNFFLSMYNFFLFILKISRTWINLFMYARWAEMRNYRIKENKVYIRIFVVLFSLGFLK